MGNIVNSANVLGWSALLFSVAYKYLTNCQNFQTENISSLVTLLLGIQTFQIVDIVLILIGQSKGSIVGSVAQITGRLVVAWFFVSNQTYPPVFALMVTCWSIADITRYLHYILRNPLTTALRYNLFLILYPVGVYGEMMVINDYIKRNASTLEVGQITGIRAVQVAIVVGMLGLYAYMLKMRAKNYSKKGSKKDAKTKGNNKSQNEVKTA